MNRFEEDFNELQLIYEAYYAQKAGGQTELAQGKPSYRRGAFDNAVNTNPYAINQISQTTSPISDEETDPVMDMIDALIKEADSDGENYAIHQLGLLKKFIANQ
ncbi:MAG: hypothetical protein OEV22_21700 [Deltaproteobacteria bacterium]|jgi:hypothetical protein|nr:hypothetical protein [Deltaproteobacteria bacterium]